MTLTKLYLSHVFTVKVLIITRENVILVMFLSEFVNVKKELKKMILDIMRGQIFLLFFRRSKQKEIEYYSSPI